MNLKTSFALTLASVAFAMAQDATQPATSAAEAPLAFCLGFSNITPWYR